MKRTLVKLIGNLNKDRNHKIKLKLARNRRKLWKTYINDAIGMIISIFLRANSSRGRIVLHDVTEYLASVRDGKFPIEQKHIDAFKRLETTDHAANKNIMEHESKNSSE
jgi:hypothetical protein